MTDKQPEALRLADVAQRFGLGEDVAVELRRLHEENKSLRQAIEQAEKQEPVAWGVPNTRPTEKAQFMMLLHSPDGCQYPKQLVPLYTAPPKKEWVGLTDEEAKRVLYDIKVKTMGVITTEDMVRAIEAKLKEKNT